MNTSQKIILVFLSIIAGVSAELPASQQLALQKLCSSLSPSWCPDGYANAGFDYCGRLGPFVKCNSGGTSVTEIVLENFTGFSQVSGSIPTHIGLLTDLARFYARNNAINGFLPRQLNNTQVYDFNLNNNLFVGGIPTEYGQLPLVGFEIMDNQLDGNIPSTLFKPGLQTLKLSENSFYGAIPTEVGLATDLRFLLLNGNTLSGTIPTQICKASGLFELSLSNNQLTGTLPSEIKAFTSLGAFSIVNNDLTGQIPTQIGNMKPGTGSYYLLGDNNFSGTIPTEVGMLTGLSLLGIYDNPLITGPIPSEIGLLTSAHTIWLFGNSLYDGIPTTVNQLSNILFSFRVNDNLLSGTFPNLAAAFGTSSSQSQQELFFQDNYLSGSVPGYFGSQVVFNCEDTFMTPSAVCRSPKTCTNDNTETVSSFDFSQICFSGSVMSGVLNFSPADNEDCFSDYLFYLGNTDPTTALPFLRVPKSPQSSPGVLSGTVSVNTAGAQNILVYSYSGVPATSTPTLTGKLHGSYSISDIPVAACSSRTRSRTSSRSFSRSISKSPGPNNGGGGSGKSSNNGTAVGVAVAVVLIAVAAIIIGFVIYQRRRRLPSRVMVGTKSEGYNDNEL